MEASVETLVGKIETFAGNGKSRSTGHGKRAKKAGIPLPNHVCVDREGRWLYIAENGSDRVRRVDLETGILHNYAGIGETCYSGDYGPCGEAGLYLPLSVAIDSNNDLYICDSGSNRIRKVDHQTDIITTVVGSGDSGFRGDGPALEVNLSYPGAIAFDANDNLYIADTQAHRIRKYNPRTGMVTTIAGTWSREDEDWISPLTAQNLVVLSGDAIGIDFTDDQGWLRPQCSDDLDLSPYLDDGRPAIEAKLWDIVAIDVDRDGNVLLTDKASNRIRRIDSQTGIISTIAGVCRYGYDGDGKPAVRAMLNVPEAAIVDHDGNVYIADSMNHRIRKVDAVTGLIETAAGNGDSGYDDKKYGGVWRRTFCGQRRRGYVGAWRWESSGECRGECAVRLNP